MMRISCALVLFMFIGNMLSVPIQSIGYSAAMTLKSISYIESSQGLVPPNLEAGPIELEMGDVNADGNPDLVSIGDHYGGVWEEQGIMVWFGDGAGHWSWNHVGTDFGYGGIALGDVNNDGIMDVGYGMHHNYDGELGDQLLEVALGDGTGLAWIPWDDGLAANGEYWGMFGTDFSDVDNDGDLDLGSTSFGCCNGVHIYLNQGDGTWGQSWSTLEQDGYSNDQLTFGDVNSDGKPDLAVNYEYGTIYFGDGSGSFSLGQGNLPPAVSVTSSDLGDVDNDGRDELGLVLSNGAVQVWRWLSPGNWQNKSGSLPNSGPYEAIQLFDMDMDGNGDVAAFGTSQVRLWAGDGAGGWTLISSFNTPAPGNAQAFRVGTDIDHNGFPDIVLVSEEDHNHLRFFKESSLPAELEIKPVAPSANKSYRAGSILFIDWVSAVPGVDPGAVSLDLSIHGPDGPWESIVSDLPNNGRFQWLIPGQTPSTEQAYIRYTLSVPGETSSAITQAGFNILGETQEPISGLSAENDSPTILGETTLLTATVISGTYVLFEWDLGDGITDTGAAVNHIYPDIGIYTATVTASNSISMAQASTVLEIYEDPVSGLVALNSSPTGLGDTTFLTATVTSGSNIQFVWDLGDGSSAEGQFVSHIYPQAGIYTAVVTASNSVSTQTAATLVEVQPPPPTWHYWFPLLWRMDGDIGK